MQQNNNVKVNSRKFDNKIHRSWNAQVAEQNGNSLTLIGEFEEEIKHQHLGVIRRGTVSFEYYWFDRWHSIFKFYEPEGNLRNFYCNINQPPIFDKNILDFIDLDIDVIVWADFRTEVLDVDEFEENKKIYNYPDALVKKTFESLDELLVLIKNRQFPFSELKSF